MELSKTPKTEQVDISMSASPVFAQQQKDSNIPEQCGSFIRRHWGAILLLFILIVIASFLFGIWTDDAVFENRIQIGSNSYAYNLKHRKCKGRGGCSRKCPFMTEDDPRKIMCKQVENIKMLLDVVIESDKDERQTIESKLSRFSDDKVKASIAESIKLSNNVKTRAITNINQCAADVEAIDKKQGTSELITSDVVKAKNKTTAYEAAAAIMKSSFVASALQANAVIVKNEIEHLLSPKFKHIFNFDKYSTKCNVVSSRIIQDFDVIAAKSADASEFDLAFKVLTSVSATDDQVLDSMSKLMNIKQVIDSDVNNLMGSWEDMMMMYDMINYKSEPFSNDMPGSVPAEEMSRLIFNDDYSSALIKTALEPEVVTNHKKFAKERSTFDSGGGVPSVRDDDNDVVQWVGLFGRPTYRRSDGTSADRSIEPLRSIPSDNPIDMMRAKTPKLTFA